MRGGMATHAVGGYRSIGSKLSLKSVLTRVLVSKNCMKFIKINLDGYQFLYENLATFKILVNTLLRLNLDPSIL